MGMLGSQAAAAQSNRASARDAGDTVDEVEALLQGGSRSRASSLMGGGLADVREDHDRCGLLVKTVFAVQVLPGCQCI